MPRSADAPLTDSADAVGPATPSTHIEPSATTRHRRRLLALLDYDGTVTTRECMDVTLTHFTGDCWRTIWEERLDRGEIDGVECFRREIALLQAPRAEIIATMVGAAELAPGFRDFLENLERIDGRAVIVSAGLREAIEGVWARDDLPPVTILGGELLGDEATGYDAAFDPAFGDCPRCGAGGCKGAVVEALREVGEAVAVFGDGLSDLCMARVADIVFAKGTLARLCADEGIPHLALDDYDRAWSDLTAWVARWRPG